MGLPGDRDVPVDRLGRFSLPRLPDGKVVAFFSATGVYLLPVMTVYVWAPKPQESFFWVVGVSGSISAWILAAFFFRSVVFRCVLSVAKWVLADAGWTALHFEGLAVQSG